jgi:hypothetical protein
VSIGVREGSGGTLESSAGAGPSIDSVTADSKPRLGLRSECRRRSRCCWRSRSTNCSRRRCWRSVRSRNSRYSRCRSLVESPTCCLSVASLVEGIADDGSEPVPRSHRGGLRGVLRTFATTSRAVIVDGARAPKGRSEAGRARRARDFEAHAIDVAYSAGAICDARPSRPWPRLRGVEYPEGIRNPPWRRKSPRRALRSA